jgi:hypothetical protein
MIHTLGDRQSAATTLPWAIVHHVSEHAHCREYRVLDLLCDAVGIWRLSHVRLMAHAVSSRFFAGEFVRAGCNQVRRKVSMHTGHTVRFTLCCMPRFEACPKSSRYLIGARSVLSCLNRARARARARAHARARSVLTESEHMRAIWRVRRAVTSTTAPATRTFTTSRSRCNNVATRASWASGRARTQPVRPQRCPRGVQATGGIRDSRCKAASTTSTVSFLGQGVM